MSLSRILNDSPPSSATPNEPPPSVSRDSSPVPADVAVANGADHLSSHPPTPPLQPLADATPQEERILDSALEDQPSQSAPYQALGNDPRSENEEEQQAAASPKEPSVPLDAQDLDATPSKKRRKAANDDGDYRPPGTRRSLRRQSARLRRPRTESPAVAESPEPEAEGEREPTEEERRLASSDLDDCEEIWLGEIADYMLETQKRRNVLQDIFNQTLAERNAILKETLAQRYAETVDRIPLLPPPPPEVPSRNVDDELLSTIRPHTPLSANGHTYDYDVSPNHHGSADAARELENSVLDRGKNGRRGKELKRPASRPASEADSSDLDVPIAHKAHAHKRRRLGKDAGDITADVERSIADDHQSVISLSERPIPSTKGRGKGKAKQLPREDSVDSVIATPKGSKKRGPRGRKAIDVLPPQTQEHLGMGSVAPSVSGDVTPAGSRGASPALTVASGTVFEIDEFVPPLKKAKKVDDATMLKRVRALEDSQAKVWKNIARREVAKVYKYHTQSYQQRQAQLKRISTLSSIQARRPYSRTPKAAKDVQVKGKRYMREMMSFWKKNEKEERDVRRREQKEALDRARLEEEKREAARQARKLEFLISQTELYSHFVGNKLKTSEVEGGEVPMDAPAGAELEDVDPQLLGEIDFDDADHTNLHLHARHNAQEAVALARRKAQAFDTQAALERKTNEALKLAKSQAHIRDDAEESVETSSKPLVDLDSDELNFQNPTSLSGPLTIAQPRSLMAQLKEYQLKGLNWLATLYEQGINGILADEMGLGKTVQSISLLAYLAETHDIWGPFLVVAPASTLHNWQQELTRFVPKLKALPYWGNVKDRATLRKFWSKKEISYNEEAPFHVLITSYQLVTQDQQYFQRVKWQYMILDEAQNIKNAASVRWKTLLGFQCRNRLLLTGTPIQNSMQELWALLHFIMPSLFDSHDEFNEWFSKDIETAAENKGSRLNEHQLRRLHMILKPFMLRRVKRHVQNELSEKIEIDIHVDLSARQRALYRGLLSKVSVADLLAQAANIGDADSARTLMNLVMQFRKVCNHPELFERADVVAPFSFAQFGQSGPLNREGDFVMVPYSTRNPIEYSIPRLLWDEGGLLDIPHEDYDTPLQPHNGVLHKLMNIWTTDYIQRSLQEDACSTFSFLRFVDIPPSEAHALHIAPLVRRRLAAMADESRRVKEDPFYLDADLGASAIACPFRMPLSRIPSFVSSDAELPDLRTIATSTWTVSCLSRPILRWFVPPVVAPPISLYCSERTFVDRQTSILDAPLESLALYGAPETSRDSIPAQLTLTATIPGVPPGGFIGQSSPDQLPLPTMRVPEAKSLIYDSAKLARLDSLLQELKTGDHRVLIYFQMTRMMDLMEEYLVYRQYKYLRLDGSSKLEDRRDMVIDWQTRPDIFIFILSTRAGGLGINLTAADTVVFYDHDWNPSNDAQAMDRAHRLGQTRQVTVYRLITKGTIDERIIQLARVKKDVQDIVVGNKTFTDVTKPSEIVQLLLNEDQLASLDATKGISEKAQGKRPARPVEPGTDGNGVRDLWADEGDEFFGQSNPGNASTEQAKDEEDISVPAPSGRGRGRGRGRRRGGGEAGEAGTRGRKTRGAGRGKASAVRGDATPIS
ncbi:SNF2 family N-terminal domain-containing protein [Amylostereum chailletii]|nr:SNF2 family N-terminal domain-containing protein [Amylostereum chailletii]